MRKKAVSLLLVLPFIVTTLILLPTVTAPTYYVWDDHNDNHTIYAPLNQVGCIAKSYADPTGLIRLHVELGIGFWMDCKAWGWLYKTVSGLGKNTMASITYEAEGWVFGPGTADITLKAIDKSTGETVWETTDWLRWEGETRTLTGPVFYTYSNRDYLYTVEAYVRVAGGVSSYGGRDYYTGTRHIKVKSLTVESGGACPYVSTWNGMEYVLDNDLMPSSKFSTGDIVDYYMLQQPLVPKDEGLYSLLLSEFEEEHSFFDQVELLAVDHLSSVSVGVSPQGEILTYAKPHSPKSAIDDNHRNVKKLINAIDETYYEACYGSYMTLNFGDELNVAQNAKLVIRSDLKSPVYIQTMNSIGEWQTVATIYTRNHWSTDVIDMSNYLPDAKGNLKVRLQFVCNDKIDFVGLDTSPQATIEMEQGELVSAKRSKNVDSMVCEVKSELLHEDGVYAELLPGEQIELSFNLSVENEISDEFTRDFLFVSKGYYCTLPGC